jgi:Protein of unknown function (DUF3489)
MTTFTIENENDNIMLHNSAEEAESVAGAERFSSSEELAELAGSWSTARLIDIWNGLPGVTPVTKFKDKKTAVTRIWSAIQSLGDEPQPGFGDVQECAEREGKTVAEVLEAAYEPKIEQTSELAAEPEEAEVEPTTPEPEANVGEQAPDVAPTEEPATKKATRKPKATTGETVAGVPRAESKTSRVIEMLKREGGVTLEELMGEMGWLKHTTRAMLSAGGSLTKNHGLTVTSEIVGDKRTYSIKG